MKKKFFSRFLLVLIVSFSLISIIGCDDASSTNSGDISIPYTFTNNSSYTVTLSDSTGSKTIEPGQQLKAWFNKLFSISDVRYSPADKVKVVGSGLHYEFLDR